MEGFSFAGALLSVLPAVVILLVFYRIIKLAIHRSKFIIEMQSDIKTIKEELSKLRLQHSEENK